MDDRQDQAGGTRQVPLAQFVNAFIVILVLDEGNPWGDNHLIGHAACSLRW